MAMFWLLAKILNVWRIETTPEGFHRCRCRIQVQNAVPGTIGKARVKGREGWIERIFWRIPRRGEQILLTANESRALVQPAWFERRVFDANHPVTLHNPQGLAWGIWEGDRCLAQGKDSACILRIRPRRAQPRHLVLKVQGRTVDQAILAPDAGVHRYSGPSLIYGRNGVYLENGRLRLGFDPKGGRLVYLQDVDSGEMVWPPKAVYHFSVKALVPMGLGLSLADNKPLMEDMEVWMPRNRLEIGFRKKKKKLWVETRFRLRPHHPIFQVEIHVATKQTSWTLPQVQWAFPFPEGGRFQVCYQSRHRLETLWASPPARYAFPQEVHEWVFPFIGIVPGAQALGVHFPETAQVRLLGYPEGPTVDFRFPPFKGTGKRWVHRRWTLTIAVGRHLTIHRDGGILEVPGGFLHFTLKCGGSGPDSPCIPGTPLVFTPTDLKDTEATGFSEV